MIKLFLFWDCLTIWSKIFRATTTRKWTSAVKTGAGGGNGISTRVLHCSSCETKFKLSWNFFIIYFTLSFCSGLVLFQKIFLILLHEVKRVMDTQKNFELFLDEISYWPKFRTCVKESNSQMVVFFPQNVFFRFIQSLAWMSKNRNIRKHCKSVFVGNSCFRKIWAKRV